MRPKCFATYSCWCVREECDEVLGSILVLVIIFTFCVLMQVSMAPGLTEQTFSWQDGFGVSDSLVSASPFPHPDC